MSVRIKHSELDATSEVEEESVDVWISRGWAVVKDEKDQKVELSEGDKLVLAKAEVDQKLNDDLANVPGSERKSSNKSG